jgi:hypothetical protein
MSCGSGIFRDVTTGYYYLRKTTLGLTIMPSIFSQNEITESDSNYADYNDSAQSGQKLRKEVLDWSRSNDRMYIRQIEVANPVCRNYLKRYTVRYLG